METHLFFFSSFLLVFSFMYILFCLPIDRVTCLQKEELKNFILKSLSWLREHSLLLCLCVTVVQYNEFESGFKEWKTISDPDSALKNPGGSKNLT